MSLESSDDYNYLLVLWWHSLTITSSGCTLKTIAVGLHAAQWHRTVFRVDSSDGQPKPIEGQIEGLGHFIHIPVHIATTALLMPIIDLLRSERQYWVCFGGLYMKTYQEQWMRHMYTCMQIGIQVYTNTHTLAFA